MNLKSQPLYFQVELPLKLVDKSLADVAEWSYVVRIDANAYAHLPPSSLGKPLHPPARLGVFLAAGNTAGSLLLPSPSTPS